MFDTFMSWWNSLSRRNGKMKFRNQREALEFIWRVHNENGGPNDKLKAMRKRYLEVNSGAKFKEVAWSRSVQILPFSKDTVYNKFNSGEASIDSFIKNKAKKTCRRSEMSVFCAHLPNSRDVIGYYALSLGSDSVSDTIKKRGDYVQDRVSFPSVHLAGSLP